MQRKISLFFKGNVRNNNTSVAATLQAPLESKKKRKHDGEYLSAGTLARWCKAYPWLEHETVGDVLVLKCKSCIKSKAAVGVNTWNTVGGS